MRSDRSKLVGLIGAEVVLVGGLHGLSRTDAFAVGWSDWAGGPSGRALEDAFGSMVLLVALGLAYWLLLSTVGYLWASFLRWPAMVGAVRRLTLPPIRRLVSRAAALSLAASALTGPLAPAVADLSEGGFGSGVILEMSGRGQAHLPGSESDGDLQHEPFDIVVPLHLQPAPGPDASVQGETPPAVILDGSIEHRVTVRRGDHLWSLSEQHLHQVLGRASLGEHEIAGYWVQVIEANRSSIRSGDPDLIYPGEIVNLPVVDPDR